MVQLNRVLWVLCLINAILVFLVVWVIRDMLYAIAAFAAFVSTWPLIILLLIGWPLSVVGLVVTMRVKSDNSRVAGYALNGATLLIHSAVLYVFASMIIIHHL